jgi:hypothetical protein
MPVIIISGVLLSGSHAVPYFSSWLMQIQIDELVGEVGNELPSFYKMFYSLVVLLLLNRGFRLTALEFVLGSAVPPLAINVNICHFQVQSFCGDLPTKTFLTSFTPNALVLR